MEFLPDDARALLVARLVELRRTGELGSAQVRQVAESIGVAERTLWRWLASGGGPARGRGRPGYELSEEDRDAFAATSGNAAAAWRSRTEAGGVMPALRTFQGAISRELLPGERAAVSDGVEGQRRHSVYLRWEARYRNERWETDHVELPVLVLPPKARKPRRPWATLFLDAYSRVLMGWALSLAPNSATVLAALRMALVVDPQRGPFGGVPTQLRPDHGLEFAAQAVTSAATALGTTVLPATAYTPYLKGKVERLGRTISQDLLCTLPFYTDGPRDAAGRLYGPDADPMTFQRFAGDFAGWVVRYNTARPHASLGGQTPLERWQADPTPITEVAEDRLRFLLMAGVDRTITKHGVRFEGLHFIAPELNGRVGQQVEVRYMPHDRRQIEVFHRGDWLCRARPQGELTETERDQVLQRRREDAAELGRRQRRASRQARARLAPVTGPGAIVETTVVTRDEVTPETTHRHDDALRRLARTDLLDLTAPPDRLLGDRRVRLTDAQEC